jgi:PRTRC genetic system ThiF family protein
MAKTKTSSVKVDLSYVQAVPVLLPQNGRIHLMLVGAGGTGSWLAPSIARLTRLLNDAGRRVNLTFVDHDIVEAGNVPRQNFCYAEIGQHKAVALATRYSAAWSVEIRAITRPFTRDMVSGHYNELVILIGCVDNAAARQELAETLSCRYRGSAHVPSTWWLDSGNAKECGQVLLGSEPKTETLRQAFQLGAACIALPSPALQHPELLKPLPEEIAGNNLSCEQLALLNAQSLMVNQRVAAEAADFALRLLTNSLTRFATYLDLPSGSARSKYITRESVAAVVDEAPDQFFLTPAQGNDR